MDLLTDLGFVNVDWRKGTPKKASPADRGRDLVAQRELIDVDGHRRFETWFVDCKHYKTGVPWDALQGLLAWSEAERPDVAPVITSGYLSNAAKDGLNNYQRNRQPPFRLRYWEKPTLTRMLAEHLGLLDSHGIFLEEMRTVAQILAAEEEFFDKVWFGRSVGGRPERWLEDGEPGLPDDIRRGMMAARHRVVEKYGIENLGPYTDWDWGYLHGHLSALRWVLGSEWDFLDT